MMYISHLHIYFSTSISPFKFHHSGKNVRNSDRICSLWVHEGQVPCSPAAQQYPMRKGKTFWFPSGTKLYIYIIISLPLKVLGPLTVMHKGSTQCPAEVLYIRKCVCVCVCVCVCATTRGHSDAASCSTQESSGFNRFFLSLFTLAFIQFINL